MNWKRKEDPPKEQGTYLCCGDEIDQLYTGEADKFFIADYVFMRDFKRPGTWIEHLPSRIDIEIIYWCELPELPVNGEIEL